MFDLDEIYDYGYIKEGSFDTKDKFLAYAEGLSADQLYEFMNPEAVGSMEDFAELYTPKKKDLPESLGSDPKETTVVDTPVEVEIPGSSDSLEVNPNQTIDDQYSDDFNQQFEQAQQNKLNEPEKIEGVNDPKINNEFIPFTEDLEENIIDDVEELEEGQLGLKKVG